MQKQYVCLRCAEKFWVEVISYAEARERQLPTNPISCRTCHRSDVVKPIEEVA